MDPNVNVPQVDANVQNPAVPNPPQPPPQIPVVAPLPQFNQEVLGCLKDLGIQLGSQAAALQIKCFHGESKGFKQWLKNVEKQGTLLGRTNEGISLLAFQSSTGPVSDFLYRHFKLHKDRGDVVEWNALKDELRGRFGEVPDKHVAMQALRKAYQHKGENVQIFAERLIELGEDAFPREDLLLNHIARQMVEIFTDGLRDNAVARKVLRESPEDFHRAVAVATGEQNILRRFSMRDRQVRIETPMEVDLVKSEEVMKPPPAQKRRNFSKKESKPPRVSPNVQGDQFALPTTQPKSNYWLSKGNQGGAQAQIPPLMSFRYANPQSTRQYSTPFPFKCFSCGEKGHMARHCTKYPN